MLVDDIARAAAASGAADRVALVHGASRVTYAALWDRIGRARAWFQSRFAPGERVLLVLENSPELVVTLYGAIAAGLVVVPVDAGIHARNLEYVLADCEPAVFVSTVRLLEAVASSPAVAAIQPCLVGADGVPRVDLGGGALGLEEVLGAPAASAGAERTAAPDQPAVISYTTGTTGPRKGTLLSQRALAAAARNINAFMQLEAGVVELLSAPLTHSFGFGRLRCVFAVQGTVVLPDRLNRPNQLLEAITQHGVASMGLIPMTCRMLMDHFRPRLQAVGSQLRFVELGSDFIDRRYKEQLLEVLPNARICMHYGLTEASRSTFIEFRSERDHLDTIGRATPNVEVAVVDGEIRIRGETVMLGYWRKPELTQQALRDGWLCTGDLAEVDANGYLRLRGRQSDVFKIAGFSVAPQEVEAVLARHPLVKEVAVALVASEGSTAVDLTAFVVASDPASWDEVALRSFCRAELEAYKVPTRFVQVPSLPRTASGKLQRAELARLVPARE